MHKQFSYKPAYASFLLNYCIIIICYCHYFNMYTIGII